MKGKYMSARSFMALLVGASMLAACGSQTTPTASPSTEFIHPRGVIVTAPPTQRAQAVSTSLPSPTPKSVTIPPVEGQNAEIIRKKLENLGLTDVSLASANPEYSVVILAANWTCVSIEPAPGTVVQSNDTVVVKVYKP